MEPVTEWIGVAKVAVELKMTRRQAWEFVKRIGVPMLNGDRKMADSRFRREAYEAARDRSEKPAPPRIPGRSSYIQANNENIKPPTVANPVKIDKLAQLRKA